MSITTTNGEHSLGPSVEFPAGEGRVYVVEGEQIAVFRLPNGQLRAVSAVCPHRGGPIADGQIDDHVVLCPLHLKAYDLSTGQTANGDPPLSCYPVSERNGVVFVSL